MKTRPLDLALTYKETLWLHCNELLSLELVKKFFCNGFNAYLLPVDFYIFAQCPLDLFGPDLVLSIISE